MRVKQAVARGWREGGLDGYHRLAGDVARSVVAAALSMLDAWEQVATITMTPAYIISRLREGGRCMNNRSCCCVCENR